MSRSKTPKRKLKVFRLALILVALLLAIGGLIGLHFVQVRRQAGQLLVRADAMAKKEDWAAAAQLYKSYVKIRRDQPEVLAAYSKILEELRKSKPETILELQKVYEEYLVLEPQQFEPRKKLARIYLQMQQFPAAEVNLKTLSAQKEAAQDVELQVLWADWHQLYSKNYSTMAEYLRKAIATGKADPVSYGRLARLLKVDIKPQTPENDREAEEVIARLLKDWPNDIKARLVRADYRFYFHGPDAAREEVLFAYRSIPDGANSPEVAIALQRLAVTKDDLALAKDALLNAIKTKGEDSRLRLALADVLARGSDPESARKTLQSAIENAPPDIVLVEVCERLLAMGDSKSALIQADRLALERRMVQFSYYLRGRAYLVQGNWPEAIEPLKRGLAGLQTYPQQQLNCRLALADCYKLANKHELRRDELRTAEKLDPKSLLVKLNLAECYADLGQPIPAMEIYTAILPSLPAARAPLARLRLAQQAARPDKERAWIDVEDVIGPEPLSGELAVTKANMLFLREKPDEALKVLESACTRPDTGSPPRVALVAAVAIKDRATAARLLDRFEVELKNAAEIRIARVRFLLQEERPDLAAIMARTEKMENLSPADQFRVLNTVGELLAQTGHFKEAIKLFKQIAGQSPFDPNVRLTLFDLGLTTNDSLLRAEMRKELTKLEGPDGPTTIVAEVTEAMTLPGADGTRAPELRKRVKLAKEARPNWARVHVLLGDIERLARQTDAALENYREALKAGDQSDSLMRTMIPMLLDRQAQSEVLEILAKRNRLTPLPSDLAQQLALLRSIFSEESDKSVNWAKSAQALASRDYRDHLRRASIFVAGNAFPDARQALEKALSLNNAAPDAWLAMIQFLILTERPQEALAARKTAETSMKSPSNTPADNSVTERIRAFCRELTGDPSGAEEAYKTAIAFEPGEISSHEAYIKFLLRMDRRTEVTPILTRLIQSAETPVVRRWARRSLAALKLTSPEAYAERGAALQLIETNLAEAGNLVDDVRMKALLLALDPFQQVEAINLILETAKQVPLNAEQSYMLARMYQAQGNLTKADETLRTSTRAVQIVAPEHLALLVQIQIKRKLTLDARQTLERLKAVAPKTWSAVSEESRVLAAEGKTDQASKLLLEQFGKQPRAILQTRVAPFLEQIGCVEAARQIFTTLAEEKGADTHLPLVSFLLRQNQGDEAWKLIVSRLATASPGPSARLIGSTARSKPLGLLTGMEQKAWQNELLNAEAWVKSMVKSNPDGVDFLISLADLADAQGRHDEAIAGYKRALEKAPEQVVALNNLAVLLALHNKDRSATPLQMINQVINKRGPLPTFLDTRALVHFVAERYDDANKDLEAALRVETKPVYQFHLAWVYDKQSGDRGELKDRRDNLLKVARSQGLTKQNLHPSEWAEYDRLMGLLR